MKSMTIKEMFKAVNDYNNLTAVLGDNRDNINDIEIVVYIDGIKYYRGTSYKECMKELNQYFIQTLVNQIDNILICGSSIINLKGEYNYEHQIEFLLID